MNSNAPDFAWNRGIYANLNQFHLSEYPLFAYIKYLYRGVWWARSENIDGYINGCYSGSIQSYMLVAAGCNLGGGLIGIIVFPINSGGEH